MQVPEPHLCFFKIYDPNECFWSGIYFQEPCNPAQSLPCAVFRARAHTHTHTLVTYVALTLSTAVTPECITEQRCSPRLCSSITKNKLQ